MKNYQCQCLAGRGGQRCSSAIIVPLPALLFFFLMLLIPAIQVLGDDITLQPPEADAYIYKWLANSNFGASTSIEVQSWANNYHERSLLVFDLSGIPAGSTVNTATLEIYLHEAFSGSQTIGAHRINSDRAWVEGEVTWNQYQSGSNWSGPGGDYHPVASDETVVTTAAGWYSWDVTADLQVFVDTSSANQGWILLDEGEGNTVQRLKRFYAREHPSAGTLRPRLVVSYAPEIPLPVRLSAFSAEQISQAVLLRWTSASELNNQGFIIERKTPGGFWRQIAGYDSEAALRGQGTSNSPAVYHYRDVAVDPGRHYLYRLSDVSLGGIVQRLDSVYVYMDGVESPENITLGQNWPNPFNGRTRIGFLLNSPAAVSLTIYSANGRRVKRLVQGKPLPAGYHAFSWDGRDQEGRAVASGVYFYTLAVPSSISTRTMILIR